MLYTGQFHFKRGVTNGKDFSIYFLVFPEDLPFESLEFIKIEAIDISVLAPIKPANQGLSK